MSTIVEITTEDEFKALLESASDGKVAIVDFYATWCGPCKTISPKFEAMVKTDFSGRVVAGKVDVDVAEAVATAYAVKAMPTFLIFKDGKKVGEVVGAAEGKLRAAIEKGLE
eukprot:m.3036 g.3036  ORF g.3036 m.3036 type:complete len:112 (+) comp9023_c0_seq1:204-539(+)